METKIKCPTCGYYDYPIRSIVLTCPVPCNLEGKLLASKIKAKDMPYGNFRLWVEEETATQEPPDELFCKRCFRVVLTRENGKLVKEVD